ncbi:hypothetical protein G7074_18790 [Pedobacter sp. HDW13]|uniref:hypothetical protein n=1 Tax=unclassified Pedobacter TaxID=2628915 RepID=UPI000F595C69|nr:MULTISPECIES: hypothetical protein [unclassified Pedobacter]QIL41133.1 hypothetical protein G7074_18790 [Pedobacter sp. HDW13]RQO64084.1 hypothetical protein DBR40_26190 [Pedobacter sp. KBW01]
MKRIIIYLVIAALPFAYACNQNKTSTNSKTTTDSVIKQDCYKAGFEKDTAYMNVEIHASGKATGKLLIRYNDKPSNMGAISGKFNGDTLLVDYRFKTGKDTVSVYTNPLAFLKKDGKLIMGVGQIETTLGRSYFVKGKPINYEAGKFIFEEASCK